MIAPVCTFWYGCYKQHRWVFLMTGSTYESHCCRSKIVWYFKIRLESKVYSNVWQCIVIGCKEEINGLIFCNVMIHLNWIFVWVLYIAIENNLFYIYCSSHTCRWHAQWRTIFSFHPTIFALEKICALSYKLP